MKKYLKVIAFGAHPDDVEFSCLGYLMRLHDSGSNICIYIATSGSNGDETSGRHRIQESINTFSCINSQIIAENNPGLDHNNYEIISLKIRNILLDLKPDLILIHSEHDTHQEHRLLREIVLTASRRIPCTVLSYKSVSVTASYVENYFVNVTDQIELKIKFLQNHISQLHHNYMNIEFIKNFHISWFAKMRGISYVESYHLEQEIIE